MTIVMMGVCRDGRVARDIPRWKDPHSGQTHSGIAYDTCEKCGGKGCAKAPAAEVDVEQ